MHAFSAARRTLLLMMSVTLLLFAFSAQAGEDTGYLGVMLQDVTPSMAKALQMGDKTGVMVSEVVDDGPADKAGFEDGDVILEFNGKTILDNGDLVKAVRKTTPGDNVKVVVLREGKNKTLNVEIGENEDSNVFFLSNADAPHVKHLGMNGNKVIVMSDGDDAVTWTMDDDSVLGFNSDRGYMGIHLDSLNEQMGEYFGVSDGEGALVTEVIEDSPAAEAGMKAGDVIVKLGDQDIDSPDALYKAVADTEPGQQLAVKVVRKGQDKSVDITLGEMPEDAIAKQIRVIREGDDHFSVHTAPRMMKYFGGDDDVDVRVIRPNDSETQEELDMMRQELDKMRQELQEMKDELKK